MFILKTCFIYYERQMSFQLAVAAFQRRDLAPMVKAKTIPVLILSFAFMAFSHLPFCQLWCSVLMGPQDECCLSDFVVLFVSSWTAPFPPLCECTLSSDPSSPLPYFSCFFKRIMGDIFIYHSISLEAAGVSSERFVGSADVFKGIICILNQRKYSHCLKIHVVNIIK